MRLAIRFFLKLEVGQWRSECNVAMLLDFNEKEKRAKMELSILLMEQIAKLFIMIFMGYVVVKIGLLKDEDSKVLSTLVLYLIVPCVILNAFQVDYTPEKVSGLELACIASLLLLFILLPVVNLIGKVLKLNEVETMSHLLFQFWKSDRTTCCIYAWR